MKKFLNFDQFVNEKYTYVSEADGDNTPAPAGGDPAPATPGTSSAVKIDLGSQFPSGKWKLTPELQQSLNAQFSKLSDYIKAQGTSGATININSGESKVPNHDAEAQPGADGKYPTLQPGELAQKRAETVKAAVDQFLAGLKQQGIDTSKIQVSVTKPQIGGPDWKPGMNASNPQFTQHQFVNIQAQAQAANPLSQYATKGEIIYDQEKKAFGTLHYLSSTQGSASNVNTQEQPAILRLCDGNTGKYLNQYVNIPAGQTQTYFGTTNTVMSDEIAQKLKSEAKPVPQNDPLYGKTINAAQ